MSTNLLSWTSRLHTHTHKGIELNWLSPVPMFLYVWAAGGKMESPEFLFFLIFVFDFVNLWPSPPSPPVKDFWFSYHKWRIVKRRRCSSISSPLRLIFPPFCHVCCVFKKEKNKKKIPSNCFFVFFFSFCPPTIVTINTRSCANYFILSILEVLVESSAPFAAILQFHLQLIVPVQ